MVLDTLWFCDSPFLLVKKKCSEAQAFVSSLWLTMQKNHVYQKFFDKVETRIFPNGWGRPNIIFKRADPTCLGWAFLYYNHCAVCLCYCHSVREKWNRIFRWSLHAFLNLTPHAIPSWGGGWWNGTFCQRPHFWTFPHMSFCLVRGRVTEWCIRGGSKVPNSKQSEFFA